MTRKICICLFLLSLLFSDTNSAAENSSKLLEMNGFKNKGMTRIYFVFDKIPEFDIDNSGQRVRLLLSKTSIDPLFNNIAREEVVFRVETDEGAQKTIVDLYFRNIPKFVDFTIDETKVQLLVNIFWHPNGITSRPGIMDRKFGEYKADRGGVVAKKVVSSRYCGRWIEFFKEYEWPVPFDIPIAFSFPPFPSKLIEQNSAALPKELFRENTGRLWYPGEADITGFLGDDNQNGLYGIVLAEYLIRQKEYKKALNVLDHKTENPKSEEMIAWKRYFRS